MLEPIWPAPPRVRALVTTRTDGDMASEAGRGALRARLPAEPRWLKQVHGAGVVAAEALADPVEADAVFARAAGTVCAVRIADCMPVFFADEEARVVGVAHAGWRGLAAGVLEATLEAMQADPAALIAWLGPAIGPRVYEVGAEVRASFPGFESAFVANRPGHWLLDLYAVARAKLARRGVMRIYGGGFCTYIESQRFFSHRRERGAGRMAAAIWLA